MKTAVELRAAFAARELSPVELIDAAAEHAELGAFVTLTLERAREEAKAAERAYRDGTARPLEGLTLAVKDLYDTEGVPTTYGSSIFKGHVPKADAFAVQRAKSAGAIVVGKTLTHEFAWGITSNNPHFPPCCNPWDAERIPGGSSGGSAVALATGGAALALATDTGGSIRIPAAFCGVSGLKPTYNQIPATGVFPLARSLDHAGPMGRTPADVRLFYAALTGSRTHPLDAAPSVAICPDLHLHPLTPGIQRAFDGAATALGAFEVGFDEAARIYPAFVAIQSVEAALAHSVLFPTRKAEYGEDVAARIERARTVTVDEYVEATATRERLRTNFARVFAAADLLLTPIHALPPELRGVGAQSFRDAVLPYTVPQNLAGLPSAAVPVGFDEHGLPVGVQLTGPAWSEGRVLAAAEALFSATASAREESASIL
ncbi:amidase [Solirubrobacter ginsenosidimutans]|uniref:Amidase n=1 Tax=Solirubrobacter ginsenosidimutans TaxID=490573 RepID=A0A9X3MNM5_9ACTN|nr:amidase [Solirubrobacter ginsenosidimutans]MDA0159522.1 amidase [Solirubrobacter ginsenosidimutans]